MTFSVSWHSTHANHADSQWSAYREGRASATLAKPDSEWNCRLMAHFCSAERGAFPRYSSNQAVETTKPPNHKSTTAETRQVFDGSCRSRNQSAGSKLVSWKSSDPPPQKKKKYGRSTRSNSHMKSDHPIMKRGKVGHTVGKWSPGKLTHTPFLLLLFFRLTLKVYRCRLL